MCCLLLPLSFFAPYFCPPAIVIFQKQTNYGLRHTIWRMEGEMVKGMDEKCLGESIQLENHGKRNGPPQDLTEAGLKGWGRESFPHQMFISGLEG